MKFKHLFLGLFALAFIVSCSSDDEDTGPAIPENTTINYFPLSTDNQWAYLNTTAIPDQQYTNESQETLTATDTATVSETKSYTFTSDASEIKDKGVMTMLLTHGYVNKVEGKVIFNGKLEMSIPILSQTISIPTTNLVLLDQNANAGQPLSTISNSYTQTLNFSGTTVPVTINYTLETAEGSLYESYDNGVQEYQDVVSSTITLNLSATANIMNFDMEVLIDQPVLTTTNYYAKDVGLILSESDIHMEFEDLSEFGVPQLPSVIGMSSQILEDHSLQ